MPELPEVETIKLGLQSLITGKKITSVNITWPKSFDVSEADIKSHLIDQTVTDIRRRAKVLVIELSNNYSLVIHLKMTGQVVYRGETNFGAGHPTDSLIGMLPDRSTRVEFTLGGQDKLFFNDQRKFGWIKLLPNVEIENLNFFKKVGPEPLMSTFTYSLFRSQLNRRAKSAVKAVLLDQTVIAGIGNIYADESLWMAKINPMSKIAEISESKLNKLHQSIIEVLQLSIDKGGSTDRNYIGADGKKGSYLQFANVFRRENQPCPRCQTTIIKIRVAGRGTHICPKCQKISK